MGMARSHGVTLAIAAIFGPTATGVFALANRFGGLLTYLNEPARLFTMPRVADKSMEQVRRLYFRMLWLNAALGITGIAFLIGLYLLVSPPFPTDPPFPLYTLIIMAGAAFNLFVGPVGIILAMSGNERNNFFANIVGLVLVIGCIALAAMTDTVVIAVISVAASSVVINLINILKLLKIMRGSQ
ncbi:hypothetical protein SAMN04487993_101644 [Salipiger marinus]|uniref:Polysaccharide biosynthesis protein C-terminal domain-containing protein n=2 Tax=Salipiger marinus TaxID=555512 RepID=A0A1G8QKR6_9RHOB|nr:hypothetical protein SAMN04487993_101644 [Salipiger marinus]